MIFILSVLTFGYALTYAINNRVGFGAALFGNGVVAFLYAIFLGLFQAFGAVNIDWTGFAASGTPTGASMTLCLGILWVFLVGKDLIRGVVTSLWMLFFAGLIDLCFVFLWAVLFWVLSLLGVVVVNW